VKNYEQRSLIKFFLTYFLTVAIFIVGLGYFYFQQQRTIILQDLAMNMHQYIVKLKQSQFNYSQPHFKYEFLKNFSKRKQLPEKVDDQYIKVFPILKQKMFIKVSVDDTIIDTKLNREMRITIIFQILILIVFLIISYILARISLRPMQDTISHMDRFIKDLIHDLNTPITSISLNSKMLQKEIGDNKKLNRINQSVNDISSLYENLDMILDEQSIDKSSVNIKNLIENITQTYKLMYPNIKFNIKSEDNNISSNEKALRRIVDNILSNACKYSKDKDAKIDITFRHNHLSIKDNGKGMQYPKKIFERSYKEDEKGHGIGMHIVHRLCVALDIDITVESIQNQGTAIVLKF
jgi:two-component system OmpR family sensor kinase